MADLVFVRANPNAPVKEGAAVTTIPTALHGASGAIFDEVRPEVAANPNGQAAYAQAVLANRFRHYAYYYGQADGADNPAQPTF